MNDFEQKIFQAVKQAVQEVYGLEPEDNVLTEEVPRDTKLGEIGRASWRERVYVSV